MSLTLRLISAAPFGATLVLVAPTLASAEETVRIAQGVSTLSFVPIWAARALNTFAPQGLTASAVVVPGGDAAALTALDAGDIDLAAVGTESVLRADAKGQPFQIVGGLVTTMGTQHFLTLRDFAWKCSGNTPADLPPDAEVRVLVALPEDTATTAPVDALKAALLEAGAHGVHIARSILPREAVECSAIAMAQTDEAMLGIYWDSLGADGPDPAQRTRAVQRLAHLKERVAA